VEVEVANSGEIFQIKFRGFEGSISKGEPTELLALQPKTAEIAPLCHCKGIDIFRCDIEEFSGIVKVVVVGSGVGKKIMLVIAVKAGDIQSWIRQNQSEELGGDLECV
jgi:hypothetical protein